MTNVVPGNGRKLDDGLRNLNNGDYADFERRVGALASDPAKHVEAGMELVYSLGNTGRRPDFFNVSYRVDDGEWSTARLLENRRRPE